MEISKRALRARMQSIRAATHDPIVGHRVSSVLADVAGVNGPVAGYWPIREEIDPRPALAKLAALGVLLGLPVVTGRAEPLSFRRWNPDAPMVQGAFGVPVPAEGETVHPATLIVPLLAFDRAGWRLGYGAGFYDRTLAHLRPGGVRAIGFAYAAQEVASVPHTVEDQRLHLVVTENEVIHTEAFAS